MTSHELETIKIELQNNLNILHCGEYGIDKYLESSEQVKLDSGDDKSLPEAKLPFPANLLVKGLYQSTVDGVEKMVGKDELQKKYEEILRQFDALHKEYKELQEKYKLAILHTHNNLESGYSNEIDFNLDEEGVNEEEEQEDHLDEREEIEGPQKELSVTVGNEVYSIKNSVKNRIHLLSLLAQNLKNPLTIREHEIMAFILGGKTTPNRVKSQIYKLQEHDKYGHLSPKEKDFFKVLKNQYPEVLKDSKPDTKASTSEVPNEVPSEVPKK